jgi:hypothetical protein
MFLMPGLVIALYTCGVMDKVGGSAGVLVCRSACVFCAGV